MKYELSENFSKTEGLESFNIIGDLVNTQIKELLKKRENQILERLAQLGHTFSNEVEKHEFAKTRLTMHTYIDKPKWRELYLDKTHLIASWWETVDFDGKTMISGKHPSECGWGFEKFLSQNDLLNASRGLYKHLVSGWFFSGWVTARKSLRALAVFRQKT